MECYNTKAAIEYARTEGEKDQRDAAIEIAMTDLYSRIEKHIKADPLLVAFAEKHCDDLDEFIMATAKEQMKIEGF